MIQFNGTVYTMIHPTTEVTWVAWSLLKAIELWGFLFRNTANLHEAVLAWERLEGATI